MQNKVTEDDDSHGAALSYVFCETSSHNLHTSISLGHEPPCAYTNLWRLKSFFHNWSIQTPSLLYETCNAWNTGAKSCTLGHTPRIESEIFLHHDAACAAPAPASSWTLVHTPGIWRAARMSAPLKNASPCPSTAWTSYDNVGRRSMSSLQPPAALLTSSRLTAWKNCSAWI